MKQVLRRLWLFGALAMTGLALSNCQRDGGDTTKTTTTTTETTTGTTTGTTGSSGATMGSADSTGTMGADAGAMDMDGGTMGGMGDGGMDHSMHMDGGSMGSGSMMDSGSRDAGVSTRRDAGTSR